MAARSPRSLVSAASALQQPLSELHLDPALPIRSQRSHFVVTFHTAAALPEHLLQWMFRSVECTLRPLYESSRIGWHPHLKRQEFSHPQQRFLVVWHRHTTACAFLSFRWDVEERRAVMYVYELFVDSSYRARGIAVALMTFAESLCQAVQIPYIMLTVFCDNAAALNLYRNKLHYVTDQSCPTEYGHHHTGYQILSKRLF